MALALLKAPLAEAEEVPWYDLGAVPYSSGNFFEEEAIAKRYLEPAMKALFDDWDAKALAYFENAVQR